MSAIANILSEKFHRFAELWAAYLSSQAADELPISGDRSDFARLLNHYRAIVDAVRHEQYEELCDTMYQEGMLLAVDGASLSNLVRHSLAVTRLLRQVVQEETMVERDDGYTAEEGQTTLDEVENNIMQGLLSGYDSGRERMIDAQEEAMRELNLRNRELRGQTDKRLLAQVAQLSALQEINAAANSSRNLDHLINVTVQAISGVLKTDVCSIFLYEGGDYLVLRATDGLRGDSVGKVVLRLGEGVTGTAAVEGQPIAVRDAWNDARFKYVPNAGEESFRSILAVPILIFTEGRHELVGVVTVQTLAYRDFADDEVKFLEILCGEISIAIENARLSRATDERLGRKMRELETMQWISRNLVAGLNLSRVLNQIVQQALPLTQADMAALFRFAPGAGEDGPLQIVASYGLSEQYVRELQMPYGWGALGEAITSGAPVYIADVPSWLDNSMSIPDEQIRSLMLREGYRSLLCVPLATAHQKIGGICIYTRVVQEFSQEQRDLFVSFADLAAIAIENASLYAQLERGLEQKSLLLRELQHRVRNNLQAVAALLLMQARRAEGSAAGPILRESVARIGSIAAVHDLLNREEVGRTSLAALAKEIFDVVSSTMKPAGMQVDLQIAAGEIMVGSKEATLLALALTELFSNILLHGFSLDRLDGGGEYQQHGTISVQASHAGADPQQVLLEIRDNGRGLDPGFNPSASHGLGLQIIQTLVERDLGGSYEMQASAGGGLLSVLRFKA